MKISGLLKRLFLIIFSLILTFTLPACGNSGLSDLRTAAESDAVSKKNISEAPPDETEDEKSAAKGETEEEPANRINKDDSDFYILYTKDKVDFTNAPKAYIDIYRWGSDYTPKAYAQVIFKEGDGFCVRMECEETEPRAVYRDYNDPVYEDSCLEFFIIYMPDLSGKYINTEMNANGAYLCYFCESNSNNVTIDTVTGSMPAVTSFKTETSWGVSLYVPLGLIRDAYGSADITLGSKVLANFYKCGDNTAVRHYGSWNEVINESPNFHLPEYFAEIEIKE
ncbi:MAG: carbohydrate-binding family 9-like protein [Eubacteriales bacterium]